MSSSWKISNIPKCQENREPRGSTTQLTVNIRLFTLHPGQPPIAAFSPRYSSHRGIIPVKAFSMNCSHLLSFSHKSVLCLNPVPRSTRQVAFLPVSVDRGPRAGPVARAQEWDQALSQFPGFREELILISLFVRKRDRAQVNGPSLSPPPSPTAGSSPHGHALSSTVYTTRPATPGPSPLAPPLHACSQPTENQSETDSLLEALSTDLSVPQFPDLKIPFSQG